MDTIECAHCNRQCVPRLWHYRPFLGALRYLKTQHMCPFCGSVMYETGGYLTPIGLFCILLFGGVLGCIALAMNVTDFNIVSAVATFLGIGVWAAIFYGLYRFVKRLLG